jgi:hypothetical protein
VDGPVLILFAHKTEANAFLFHSGINFIKKDRRIYQASYGQIKLHVSITGIGKNAVGAFLKNICLDSFPIIIKAGACGVIDPEMPVLKPLVPSFVSYCEKRIQLKAFSNKKIEEQFRIDKGLMTLDKPLSDSLKASQLLKQEIGCVDMETFFILENVCAHQQFIPFLIGSDRAGKTACFEFIRQIKTVSKLLGNGLIELFKIIA